MKTARWTLFASVVIAGVLTFGALGSGAGAARRAQSTSKAKGPLIAFSALGAACGNVCVGLEKSIFAALKAEGYTNYLKLDNNLDPTKIIANAHTVVARHAALYIDTDGGITNYKVTLALMKKAHIPLFLIFGGPPPGSPPNVSWTNADKATAGKVTGKYAAAYAKAHWGGKVDGLFATWLSSWSTSDKQVLFKFFPALNQALGTNYSMTSGTTLVNFQGQAAPIQAATTAFLNAHPGQHRLIFFASTNDTDAVAINTALVQAGRIGDGIIYSVGTAAEGVKLLCADPSSSAMQGDMNWNIQNWGKPIVRVVKLMLAKKPFPRIIFPPISMVTRSAVKSLFDCNTGLPK